VVEDSKISYSKFSTVLFKNLEFFAFKQGLSKTFSVRAPSRRDVAHTACARPARRPPRRPHSRPRRPRQPVVPGRAPSPGAAPRGLGILPAVRTPWTVPYRPVRAADRRSVGSTPPYARRSRWPCYGSICGITVTSPGRLSYKSPSAVRLRTPHRPAGRHCRRHRVHASPLAFTAGHLVQYIP
jgi:hypothetical protein